MDDDIIEIFSVLHGLIDIDEDLFEDGIIKFHFPIGEVSSENRFAIPPNFKIPGLCPERPLSADNRVAFHMGHSVVVKHANYEASGGNVPDHAIIVSADGRTISTSAAKFDHYISRDGAVLVVRSTDGDETRALFTNIHSDDEERRQFWNAATKIERRPSRDVVTLYPERLPEEKWSEIVENYDGPPELMWGLARVQADLFTRLMPLPGGRRGAVSLHMPRGEFARLRRYLKRIGGWDREHPVAEIKRGLGGRIQRRLVAELPTGLTDEAMYRVAQKFAQYLAGKQVMYTVVVHAPDAHNDERNFHIHAVIYDRPSEFLKEHGCWDFEYCVPVKGYRNRVQYPHRKNKIASLSRPNSGNNFRQYGVEVMMMFRETYANICNEELLGCGSKRLFDHRNYEAMGIRQKPIKRLSRRHTLLSAAGIPTAQDAENAERSWQGAFDRAFENHLQLQKRRGDLRDRALQAIAAARDSGLSSEALRQIECHLDRFDSLVAEIEPREWPVTKLYLTFLMAISRADKTSEMCQRLIDGIDAGAAKASDLSWEDEIRDRYTAAIDHSDNVERTVLRSIQAINVDDKIDELGHLESEIGCLIETIVEETYIARASAAILLPTATEATSSESTSSPDKAIQFESHSGHHSDAEEVWERTLNKAEIDDSEVDAPSRRDESHRLPGLPDQEQELSRDPGFAKRSQQRLKALYRRLCSRWVREETNSLPAIQVSPTPQRASNERSEASSSDAGHAGPVSPCPYDEALKRRKAHIIPDEVLRQETAQFWRKEFEDHFLGKPLPIAFKGYDPIIDVARLPSHLAQFAEAFPDDVNGLIRPFVDYMRELARDVIFNTREPLIHIRNGQAQYDPMAFCPELRRERTWLLDLDPVVHRYAMEAIERSPQVKAPKVSNEEPRQVIDGVCRDAGTESIITASDSSVESQTQAEFLRRRAQLGL